MDVTRVLFNSFFFVALLLSSSQALTLRSVNQAAAAGARTELDELQPGVKYATNRGPYKFSEVPVIYRGDVYFRGDNDKSTAKTTFVSDEPVRVFVAIDSRLRRHVAAHPHGWKETADSLTFTHNGVDAIGFHIYYWDFPAGLVSFSFRTGVVAGVFIMENRHLPGPKLTNVVQAAAANSPTKISRLQTGSFYLYATNRNNYHFSHVPKVYENSIYLRGDNDKDTSITSFFTDKPVEVFVAIDTRNNRNRAAFPADFQATGNSLTFSSDGSNSIPFAVYQKSFPAGKVDFALRQRVMSGIFVREIPINQSCLHIRTYGLSKVCQLCKRCSEQG